MSKCVHEEIIEFIKEKVDSVLEEERSTLAMFIAFQATVAGAYNTFEGVGILEAAKMEYVRVCDQVLGEEDAFNSNLN